MFCHSINIPCPASIGCLATGECLAGGCPATVGCPTTEVCAATKGSLAITGRLATVGCPAIAGCPTNIKFCSLATYFKYLLPSSEILCCPAWIACWFLLLPGLQCFKLSKILVILIQLKLEVQLLFKLGSLDWLNN
jgi:hypothetical protein